MQKTIPVWDIWVRLGHWLIVLVFYSSKSLGRCGYIDAHATVGILLGGWVLFRILWGFIGPNMLDSRASRLQIQFAQRRV